jgi:hypothetical protein
VAEVSAVNALERQVMEFALRGEHPTLDVLRDEEFTRQLLHVLGSANP